MDSSSMIMQTVSAQKHRVKRLRGKGMVQPSMIVGVTPLRRQCLPVHARHRPSRPPRTTQSPCRQTCHTCTLLELSSSLVMHGGLRKAHLRDGQCLLPEAETTALVPAPRSHNQHLGNLAVRSMPCISPCGASALSHQPH